MRVTVCVCREASTPQEASGPAPARLPTGRHQDGIYHPHPLRYHQGGSAAIVIGQQLLLSNLFFFCVADMVLQIVFSLALETSHDTCSKLMKHWQ